jgi:hypothetical protein
MTYGVVTKVTKCAQLGPHEYTFILYQVYFKFNSILGWNLRVHSCYVGALSPSRGVTSRGWTGRRPGMEGACECSRFIPQSVLRQAHGLFQSEFAAECHLVLPVSIQYPLFSLNPSSSCLRLLSLLTVTSVLPSIFHSITWFRTQFVRKMWPVSLSSFFLMYVGYSSALL